MGHITFQPISVSDAFDSPLFAELCAEYHAESARNSDLLPEPPSREMYEALVAAGSMVGIGAYADDTLVGFCAVIFSPVLHYGGEIAATTESLFIGKAYRNGLAGVQLIREAERVAASCGAKGLYVSAPVGGTLEKILPRLDYQLSNVVFYRSATP